MELKRLNAVARALTTNGASTFVRVAAGSPFTVGATVNLTSTAPLTQNGLQIASIRGVSGSTDIALYLIDPSNGQPFNATAYTTAQTATVTSPVQTLWYGVGTDEDVPYSVLTDVQMQAIMLAILPGAATAAANVTVTNFPATQPVSITSSPLPTGAATETTLGSILTKLNASVAVTGTFWQATQPISAAALPLPAGAATEATLSALSTKTPALGQAVMAASSPVVIASNQTAVPISAASLPLPTGAATETTLGSILTKLNASVAVTGTVAVSNFPATQPISAVALPLPAGAATSAAQTDGTSKVQVNQTNSFVDAGNSSTANLAGGGVFTGTPLDCLGLMSLSFSASSDVVSAVDGIELQWSPDGVYWSTRGITSLPASRIGTTQATDLHFRVHDRWFRIKYTNGAAPQTWFKLQVLKHNYQVQPDGIGVAQNPLAGTDAILTKSIISGVNEDGSYQDVQILTHDAHGAYDTPGLAVRTILDQYYITAFNEQRVSIPYTLSDIVQKYGRDARIISSSLNGGGAIADALNMSGFTLSVPLASGAYARARTNEWYRYQTGRGQQVILSLVHTNAGVANQTRNWGYFDDNDGLGFRLTGTVPGIFRRTSTGEGGGAIGAPYEEVVPRTSWNVDKMDGLGHSGVNLDVTKGNIYEVRFQWLGVGVVQWFINSHLIHQMIHPNTLAFPYMRTATLPLTWEVNNTGASSAGGMTAICGHVTSQSGSNPPFQTFAAISGPRSTTSAAELPLLSIRSKQTLNTVDNRVPILPRQLALSESAGNRTYVIVRIGATLTGAAWTSVDALSSVEYDASATSLTGGVIVARYALAGNGDRDLDLRDWFTLGGKTIGRDAYTGVSDVITISLVRVAAQNPTVDATLMFHEIH